MRAFWPCLDAAACAPPPPLPSYMVSISDRRTCAQQSRCCGKARVSNLWQLPARPWTLLPSASRRDGSVRGPAARGMFPHCLRLHCAEASFMWPGAWLQSAHCTLPTVLACAGRYLRPAAAADACCSYCRGASGSHWQPTRGFPHVSGDSHVYPCSPPDKDQGGEMRTRVHPCKTLKNT